MKLRRALNHWIWNKGAVESMVTTIRGQIVVPRNDKLGRNEKNEDEDHYEGYYMTERTT